MRIEGTLKAALPAAVKRWLRARLTQFRSAWVRRYHSFGPDDLLAALRRLGVEPGDAVIAHSSFARFEGFRGGVSEAIRTLQAAVGEGGALLMPTLPFEGSAIDYVLSGRVTDISRTPSRMGFMTEIFRRLAGVQRSIHPTHPIAIWGRNATALCAGHHDTRSPCGHGSPFHKLFEANGKILLAGASIRAMTFFHYVEELLEAQMPFSPFTREWFEAKTIGADGTTYETRMRLFDRAISSRRDCELMIPRLLERGFWRQERLGRLDLVVLRAADVVATARAMASDGRFCYRSA